jgi:hypothetical protein
VPPQGEAEPSAAAEPPSADGAEPPGTGEAEQPAPPEAVQPTDLPAGQAGLPAEAEPSSETSETEQTG